MKYLIDSWKEHPGYGKKWRDNFDRIFGTKEEKDKDELDAESAQKPDKEGGDADPGVSEGDKDSSTRTGGS